MYICVPPYIFLLTHLTHCLPLLYTCTCDHTTFPGTIINLPTNFYHSECSNSAKSLQTGYPLFIYENGIIYILFVGTTKGFDYILLWRTMTSAAPCGFLYTILRVSTIHTCLYLKTHFLPQKSFLHYIQYGIPSSARHPLLQGGA